MEFDSGESLYFREKPGWFLTSSQKKIDGIVDLYTHLAKATFENRLQRYLTELQSRGYFTYAGYRFHPQHGIICRDGREFTSESTTFLKHYGLLELRPRSQSLLEKAKREIWGGRIQSIDTLTDTDVFFGLLSHFFGIRWN